MGGCGSHGCHVGFMQPREAGGEGGTTAEEKAKLVLDDVLERLPAQFDMEEIRSRVDEVSPYIMVAIQVGTTMAGHWVTSFKHIVSFASNIRKSEGQFRIAIQHGRHAGGGHHGWTLWQCFQTQCHLK